MPYAINGNDTKMPNLIQIDSPRSGVAIITLDRPDRRNALCIAMLDELCDTIESMAANRSARVIILRGAGPIFSSGLDLSEASNPDLVQRSARAVARALLLMRNTPLVTIAAAHGGAYAGGAGLMAACDIAIGSSDMMVGFPEARRGLLPALICAVLSPKVREGDLLVLFLVGNPIDATRAQQIGLLQRVVPFNGLMEVANEMAAGILAGGPDTIAATKALLNQAYVPTDATSTEHMIELHLGARRSDEATEGLAAFLEKRPPKWMNHS
jgi:enoyl-CoA hydratase/carnithine racemase